MILERESELGELMSLLEGLDSSDGRVVLVRGEAGIGKSTLIRQFVSQVGDRAHVVVGSCDDLLTPQPLGAIWDIGRREPRVEAALRDGDRRAVMESILDLMHRTLRPTVIVIEDTQWADEATVDVIKFLGRRVGDANGLLVLTYRDGEVDVDHPLRHAIGELPPAALVRMPLSRLSEEAVAEMVEGSELSPDNILELTGGNPLFVSEVLASGTDSVPASVRDSVLARASKVSPGARRILDVVSVIPGSASLTLVDSILGLEQEQVAECTRQGLLTVDGTSIAFRHELQRRAIESSLGAVARREINRLVVDALDPDASPTRLLHHAREAGDIDLIVEYAPRAAESAMATGSTREAVTHFRLLEPYLDRLPIETRADLVEEWARAEYYLGNTAALDVLDRAIELRRAVGDEFALARTLTYGARVRRSHMQNAKALAWAAEAVEILERYEPSAELARALSLNALINWLYYEDVPQAIAIADRAVAVAEAGTDTRATIWALNTKGSIQHSAGNRRGRALVVEALRLALRAGYAYEEVRVLLNLAGMSGDVREVDRAIDFIRQAHDCAVRNEIGVLEADARAMLSEYQLWRGNWAEAEDVASETIGSAPNAATLAWRVIATLQVRRGKDEAHAGLDLMWSLARTSGQLTVMDPAAAVLAEHLWLTGAEDPERVRILEDVFDMGVRAGTPWPSGAFAFWMWKLGLIDEVPPGTADFYGWIIEGDHERAARFWGDRGLPFEKALALMHGTKAEQIEAVRIFEILGASATAGRVRRSLLDAGVKVPRGPSRATRGNVAGLTARQAEVLELLAEELTNAEIANRLFVSRRTVDNHVAAILMKFDAPSRTAAVDAARAAGYQMLPAQAHF